MPSSQGGRQAQSSTVLLWAFGEQAAWHRGRFGKKTERRKQRWGWPGKLLLHIEEEQEAKDTAFWAVGAAAAPRQPRRDVASAGGWLPLRGPGSSRERTGLQRRPSGADLPSDAGSTSSIPAWGTGLQEFARLVVQPKQTKSSKNKFKKGAEATWPRAVSHVCAVCFHRQR